MTVIAVITDPPEVRKILRHPKGGRSRDPLRGSLPRRGALRRFVRIGRAPPGLDPISLN